MTKKKKKKNNGRDLLMVEVIKGVTKSGVHKDKKKESDKTKARKKVEKTKDVLPNRTMDDINSDWTHDDVDWWD
jgi:hypothetical protein